jgi:hypothetical protein
MGLLPVVDSRSGDQIQVPRQNSMLADKGELSFLSSVI